ncbi:MAG TPA: hypothetical protein VGJ60_07255 [Chloroflexota bacterium]
MEAFGLCARAERLPDRLQDWLMEPKLDGVRVHVRAGGGRVDVMTRRGQRFNGRLPRIESRLESLELVLDGEVVWFDRSGQVDFHHGSGLFRAEPTLSLRRQLAEGPLVLMAWDILSLAGNDLRGLPIEERREVVAKLVEILELDELRLVDQVPASPEAQAYFVSVYHEGVVLKRRGSAYPRGRGGSWLKLKEVFDEDVVIMGLVEGKNSLTGTTGAVAFGQYRDGVLVQRGTCSGMDDRTRHDLWANFPERYESRVLVIRHMGHDGAGFRHPQWQYLRPLDDKAPEECLWT